MPKPIDEAVRLHREGRLQDAEPLYREALRRQPRDFTALHLLGALKLQQDRPAEAVGLIGAAIEVNRRSAAAHSNHGRALASLGRHAEALAAYDQALALEPAGAESLVHRGDTLCDLGRREEALASYEKAIALNPRLVPALVNRGLLLRELGRAEAALASYQAALAIDPANAEAHNNRGIVLQDMHRHREALASYDRALALRPDYLAALFNRGNVLLVLKRPSEALASYGKALALQPNFVEAICNRGHALADLRHYAEALAAYEQALAAKPDHFDALMGHAGMLAKLDRHDEAIAEYEALRTRYPDDLTVTRELLGACMASCRWTGTAPIAADLIKAAVEGRSALEPFTLLALDTSAAEQLASAKHWLNLKKVTAARREWNPANYSGPRLRIAYLSADYHRHATAHLIAELLELHDRSRFEIIGISFGPDDRSELRARLVKSFDRFFDVTTRSDEEAAAVVRDLNAHIAVDLKGYTTDCRIGILAQRAAPIQASYLGYPGTLGADFVDYVIADPTVLPFDQQRYYSERIVQLPDCYQVNDRKRAIAQRPPRSAVGLPDDAFVFCCFNNSWKLNQPIFAIWMRLLATIEPSVLWLFKPHPAVAANLRAQAEVCGVDPDRLIFAPPLDLPEHLARVPHADLFLDTLPYNAHTTASDALWMGVPVVTCEGATFPGRVASSLLRAVGLPELVTSNLNEYEALARALAADRTRLCAFRELLQERRATWPLFDTDRFRRHLEAAYVTMWDLWQRGEPPRSFKVEPIEVHRDGPTPS